MTERLEIRLLNRRSLLLAAGAAAVLPPFLASAGETGGSVPSLERSAQFNEAYAKLIADAAPVDGKVLLELPDIAENGNFVPVTITADSPMTESDHIKTIHLLSTANPVAKVATFHLSPLNGHARVQSRMRLAKTQDVIVLAETSAGSLLLAKTLVKVTIGGCSG